MGYFSKFVGVCAAVTLLSVAVVGAEEKDPLKPRVAPDQMADAKAMKNPVASTPESIAKGKALYEGKGTCFNCHGKEGKGDGPAGAILNPSPRNFTNCKFHKKRKDGELLLWRGLGRRVARWRRQWFSRAATSFGRVQRYGYGEAT